jgi:phosphotransacetylase
MNSVWRGSCAMLLRTGCVDGLLCGGYGSYHSHLRPVREVIGTAAGVVWPKRRISAAASRVIPAISSAVGSRWM